MRNSTYYYNSETCQYEPSSLRIKDAILYCLGVLFVGALIFVGGTLAYDRFTESALENALRKENLALDKHQVVLASQLSGIESTLNQLKDKDQKLNERLFEETSIASVNTATTDKKAILMANASSFDDLLESLDEKSTALHHQSIVTNEKFQNNISISKEDIALINSIPTLQPIANPNLDLLVSGFGTRINPFHKGKYKHPGIDFAAPRGTEVFATAQGRVIDVNKSDIQAGYGNSVDIDHGHGFVTRYSHLETIEVKAGQKVTKHMVIGTVGSSGGSIAPHLHYEVIHRGETVDPMAYMIEGLDSHAYNKLISLSKKQNQSLD
ncbi:MAG TPA: M23 family metallopeptidase [Cyclobacteriaceae bacterium]|nr:M23 family metallopeptidase [Cyclobacteriaceae bacterium]